MPYHRTRICKQLAGIAFALTASGCFVYAQSPTPLATATPRVDRPGVIPDPAPTPDITPNPDSLFVPVVPGASPVPTPTPEDPTKKMFAPSDIPPPAFQSSPETVDILDTDTDSAYTAQPIATPLQRTLTARPAATPTPTPRAAGTSSSQRAKPRAASSSSVDEALTGERLSQVMTRARVNRDAKLATQVAWANFNRKDYSSAAMWFEQAIAWDGDLGEAYYGLALTRFTTGDTSQAEAIAGYRIDSYSKMRALMGDILIRRAMDDFQSKQYGNAIQSLDKASKYRKLGRPEKVMLGWSYYYTRDYQSAANVFEELYRSRPDKPSAEGLYASLSRLKDWKRLELIAAEVPGPLEEIYMTYDTEAYYKSGLYLAAYDSNPKAYPALANFDAPEAQLGFEYNQKSGQSGESQLKTTRAPVVRLELYPAEKVKLTAQVARLELNAGQLPDQGATVGNPPPLQPYLDALDAAAAANQPPPENPFIYTYTPKTNYNDLYEVKARLEYQDWLSPYIELGSTPINADLSARLIGKAGLEYRHSSGYVNAEFYSQPIRESLLSYVGFQDPYQGQEWGRVQETGGSFSVFQGFMEDYTVFAKAKYGEITGTNTFHNDHLALVASLSKLLKYDGFEYITIGPAVSYERFNNNQNFFTYGHGGYFSPEYIVQGLIEAQFLTTEGMNWLLRGNIGAGAQQNSQAPAAYFPLSPDGQEYPGTSASTGIFLVTVEGGVLLTPEFMVGSKLSYAITADYNEGFASIYVSYFFEPRAGLFRSDLNFSYW